MTLAPPAPTDRAEPSDLFEPQPLVPDEVERIDLPGHYAGLWVEVWLNPPLDWLTALSQQANEAFLAGLIRAWRLTPAADVQPAITSANIQRLPALLLRHIVEQYWERYHRPLVRPTPALSGATSPAPTVPTTPTGPSVPAPTAASSPPGTATSSPPESSA